jgi:hypothetical protein
MNACPSVAERRMRRNVNIYCQEEMERPTLRLGIIPNKMEDMRLFATL